MLRALLLAFLIALAAPALAQDAPATLIADTIRFDGPSETITARGGVEIFYNGAVLRAETITYDGPADQLRVEGPLTLIDETGRAVFLADFAEVSGDLQNAMLRSARLVLDRELQIAATEITHTDGRYTQAYQSVASSCEVCEDNPTPLWEIRARRIVHDTEEQMLWFEGAQFRALGVPLAYFPRLRLPDPSRERAAGFLVPDIFGNDAIGTGLRMAYFQPIGARRDLTLSPYATSEAYWGTGLRYREAYRQGWIELEGQLSFDDLTQDNLRGYVFGDGYFSLPLGFELDLSLQAVTDRGYLSTYGISDIDRLETQALVARTERDRYIEASATEYNSLRDGDDNSTLPNTILDAAWTGRWDLGGGIAQLGFSGHSRQRDSEADGLGRDLARLGAEAEWRRDWVLPGGIIFATDAALYADAFAIQEDSSFETFQTRIAPFGAAELSWPLATLSNGGVHHMITPTVQLAWSDNGDATTPDGDSAIVSFDEANLFALNRFPGADQREAGARVVYGLSYRRTDPLGWSLGTTLGRVVRQEDMGQFTVGSGLDGLTSDWLLSLDLSLGRDLEVVSRSLFDDGFSFTSGEASVVWTGERHSLDGTFTWLASDATAGRPEDTAEMYLQGAYDLGQGWQTQADWRYDFAANNTTRAGLDLSYATECIEIEFSLSRRFTSSATVRPSTEFGLSVALNGFGASREGRSRDRICRH